MRAAKYFREILCKATYGRLVTGLAMEGGLSRDTTRNALVGHDPKFSRVDGICRAFSRELYIGPPPRSGLDPALMQDHLRQVAGEIKSSR